MLKDIMKRIAPDWKKSASTPKPSCESTMQLPMEPLAELLSRNIKAAERLEKDAYGTNLWPLCVRIRIGYRQLERELYYGMPEDIASHILAGWVEWHNRICEELIELKSKRESA